MSRLKLKKQYFEPVQMEIERKPIALKASEWVCCMDCGVLIQEKKDKTSTQWSVCLACKRVYIEIKDDWLLEMLVKRMNSNVDLLKRYQKSLKQNLIYLCNDCKRFYLDLENEQRKQCKWCELICKQSLQSIKCERTNQCVSCGISTERQLICDDCMARMNVVKQGLEYVNYINWMGKHKRQSAQIQGKKCNKKKQEDLEKIK